ncbi:MAG: hypothetical protein JO072_01025 [Parafilimonas sp.]|nr:hypothetical protein [Parafilimonas sp.]
MENDKKQNSEPTSENVNANANYNPANRDFQRTEEDIDNVSNSEKEELELRKQRTHEASTTPDKNHIG